MSGDNEAKLCCCASCGIAEIDEIKMVPCDGCDLVRYCGDECQELHRPEHEEDCKKRAAELRDELLFKQPESTHMGDCPICRLPLPLDGKKSAIMDCCSKIICKGCLLANAEQTMEMRLVPSCPFCREPLGVCDKRLRKRIEANDPNALRTYGAKQYRKGDLKEILTLHPSIESTTDYRSAFEYFIKAAELGNTWSHYDLAHLYRAGKGVKKDEEKEIYHLEEAAIAGHPEARYHLGIHEGHLGMHEGGDVNYERAAKHWIIAATQGDDKSIKMLMDMFKGRKKEFVRKEDLDAALRAHKAASDATKSPLRKAAEEFECKDFGS